PTLGVNNSGDTILYASSGKYLYLTTNNGDTWIEIDGYNGSLGSGFTNAEILTLAAKDSFLYAGTNGEGIFLSINNDTNWVSVNNGLTNLLIWDIAISDSFLFAATWGGVFRSTNNGAEWVAINNGLTDTTTSALVISSNGYLFAGVWQTGGIFRSTDNGNNWMRFGYPPIYSVYDLTFSNKNLFVSTNYGVFRSNDDGENWIDINNGLPNSQVTCLAV